MEVWSIRVFTNGGYNLSSIYFIPYISFLWPDIKLTNSPNHLNPVLFLQPGKGSQKTIDITSSEALDQLLAFSHSTNSGKTSPLGPCK